MSTDNQRKRLSDLKFLMLKIKSKAQELGVWVENPSLEQATSIFTTCMEHMPALRSTDETSSRRSYQICWRSHVNNLRTYQRAAESHTDAAPAPGPASAAPAPAPGPAAPAPARARARARAPAAAPAAHAPARAAPAPAALAAAGPSLSSPVGRVTNNRHGQFSHQYIRQRR